MPLVIIVLFGILAASFALILETLGASLFSLSPQIGGFSLKALLVLLSVAFIEESSKYIFLRQYAQRFFTRVRPVLKGSFLLGTLFGIGFALLEAFFLLNIAAPHPFFIFLRTAAVHIITSVAFALFIFSSLNPSEWRFSPRSLVLFAIIFHTLYNLSLFLF